MRYFNILLVFSMMVSIANGQEVAPENTIEILGNTEYTTYGDLFDSSAAVANEEISSKYAILQVADTLSINFEATVKEVCQMKGCWMKLTLQDGEEAMVRFKDYSFFVPKDMADKKVIVNGRAFVSEMSVADQKHYAEDAGASAASIEKIKTPKKTYSFLASGVALKEED